MKKAFSIVLVCALVVVLLGEAQEANAATCNPQDLMPCAASLSSGAPPTPVCCSKLRGQQPCFCSYVKNPSLGQYINSPNARKVASSCGVPIPKC